MKNDYYDLDDVLADGEKVPCRFNITVPGLGYLEGNAGKAILKESKLDLPFWIAEVLSIVDFKEDSDEKFIDLCEPDALSRKVISAIKTSPTYVDLHALMANYYKLVEKWGHMFQEPELIDTIMTMLKERATEINNFANNANKQINGEFIYTLDEFEKKLYKLTAESNKQMRRWISE